jgi:hypothetical protein
VIRALLIPADTDLPMRVVDLDPEDWTVARDFLQCRCVEPVHIADDVDLFVDEEALWKNDARLNHRASALWTLHAQRSGLEPALLRTGFTTVWNNALVVGPAVNGCETDAPGWALALTGTPATESAN